MKNFKRMALLLTVAALGACADQRSLETGLMPGEIHEGPPVEFVDAPIGTVIEADDGTVLEQSRGGWILHTPTGTSRAINAYWFDDPRPALNDTKPMAQVAAVRSQLSRVFSQFTPGASTTLQESSTNAASGMTAILTVLGTETVTVPAGSYQAVHLRRFDNSNCANCSPPLRIVQDIWFVPGLGVVQYKTNQISGYLNAGFQWKAVVVRHS